MTTKELEKAFEKVSAIPQLMVGSTEEKTAVYVSSMRAHFDGMGAEYDPEDITAFVKQKMKELNAAGTKFPL